MLRVALVFAIVGGVQSLQGADHRSTPPLHLGQKAAVEISASGSLSAGGAEVLDAGMIRRDDSLQKQAVSHSAQHAVPTAAHKQELLQVDPDMSGTFSTDDSDDSKTTQRTTPAPTVSCGHHEATFCRRCTVIDPVTGKEVKDQGSAWCNGDCTYYQEECHTLTAQNFHIERDQLLEGVPTTTGVPDLLNPEITLRDEEIMDKAADSSVEEAAFEAKQRLSNEVHREKEKKGKLLNTIIISASCVLFICAVLNVIVLVKYIRVGVPNTMKDPLTKDDGSDGMSYSEDGGFQDGEGVPVEAEGEADADI